MIEFIIPTYNRPYQLLTIIGSILSQNNLNWKIHIVADAIYPGYDDIKKIFSNLLKLDFTIIKRISGKIDLSNTASTVVPSSFKKD
jgi:glycosyltransferase involved in cell wall biosynthesis